MHSLLKRIFWILKNEIVLLALIFILCCSVLIIPPAIRIHFNNGIPPGEESYKDLAISEELSSSAKYFFSDESVRTSSLNGSNSANYEAKEDSISYLNYGPEHFVLALFISLFGPLESLIALPFICGILSFFIIYLILKEYKTDYKLSSLFMSVLFMSPIFIYTFSVFNRFCIIMPLLLIAILFLKKDGNKKYISLAVFCMFPFFGTDVFIVSIISLGILFKFSNSKDSDALLKKIIFYEFLIGTFYFIWLFISGRIYLSHDIIKANIFQDSLSMFGATIGFSLFILILAVIGVFSTWKSKRQYYTAYLIMLVLMITALFFSPLMKIPLVFFISFFASIGFLSLLHISWSLKIVGKLTITAVVFGIILSSVLYASQFVKIEPQKETVAALLWLKENSKEDVTVLSDFHNGVYIEYFADRKTVMSYDFEYMPDAAERYNDTLALFKTRDYKEAVRILNKYSVNYILIDPQMKPLMYSENNLKGLPFLLENVGDFKRVYNKSGIEIWKVKIRSIDETA
jgi:hypothetical protein